ncbi:MAG: AAA family ATPase [Stellaceae bacterium]
MLRNLKFTNFKNWRAAELNFGRITGLFGTNSSGKSSLTQFLLLLKQTKEATDRKLSLDLNGHFVSLGVYKDVIFNHDDALQLNWSLNFEQEKDLSLIDPARKRTESFARGRQITVSGGVAAKDQAAVANKLEYELGDVAFRLTAKTTSDTAFELSSSGSNFRFVRTQGRPWQLPGPVKSYAFPDQARTYYQNASFLSDLETSFEEQIDKIFYLGPLREYPQRDYLWARSRPADVGLRGEKAIDAILAATEADEKRNRGYKTKLRSFQEMIAYWLREMGLIYDFHVDEIAPGSNRWQAKIRVRKGGTEALLTDVGFGVSQVLPVVTLLQYVPEGATVILEQPEIHLHPLAQARLADVIISAAQSRRVQVIVESHSEHLLLRLQRRVAEEQISQDDLRLYFCDVHDSASTLKALDINLFGEIANWPEHFMGDAFGETFAAEKARLKRMADAQ